MAYQTLTVHSAVPGITVVTLNRPDRLNAMTFTMLDELYDAATALAADDAVRVVVLTGAGRAFCAGLDLDQAQAVSDMTTAQYLRNQEIWARAVTSFRHLAVPVIAAVNGPAAGAGFSLALAADIRFAATSARFNAAFIKVGLTGGDCGSTWMLPRIVGLGLAYEILLSGRFVDAQEAARIGLVNRVSADDALLDDVLALAAQIAGNTPLGVRLTKQMLQINVDAPSLQAALELENRSQALAAGTQDMTEAMLAFREKRAPVFTGR